MRLSDIKGVEAFKTIGKIVGCLRGLYENEKLLKIATEQKTGWIMDFFSISLEEESETWMKMFIILNPGVKEEDINLGSVIKFAYEFKNDPELMSLFFSQGEQTVKTSSGSPMVNTEATGKK